TKVTMIIEPAGRVIAPAARPAAANEPPARVRIDQQLVTIDANGKIALNCQETTAGELALKLKDMPDRGRVIVAVATPIEQTPAAREVMNALSNMQIKFEMKPQSAAVATTSPAGAVGDAEETMRRLRDQWQATVAPHAEALRD